MSTRSNGHAPWHADGREPSKTATDRGYAMLKFHWKSIVTGERPPTATSSVTTTRDDLRIRNLLDDPRLAKAMTLDLGPAFSDATPVFDLALRRDRPERVFNRRRLLEPDAA